MPLKRKQHRFAILFIASVLFVISFDSVFAINSISEGWRINNGTIMDVTDANSVCHKITNNSGYGIFVPTKYIADWNAFANNPPSGVSNGSCCAVSSWSPPTSNYCSGVPFTQTSNCGTTQTNYGSAYCPPAPAVPTLSINPNTTFLGGDIDITFSVPSYTEYYMFRYRLPNSTVQPWINIGSSSSYTSIALGTQGIYGAQIKACNAYSGCSAESTWGGIIVSPAPTLSANTGNINPGDTVTLNWSSRPRATYFQVWTNRPALGWAVEYTTNTTSFTTSRLWAIGTYQFKIVPCNATVCGIESNTVNVTSKVFCTAVDASSWSGSCTAYCNSLNAIPLGVYANLNLYYPLPCNGSYAYYFSNAASPGITDLVTACQTIPDPPYYWRVTRCECGCP